MYSGMKEINRGVSSAVGKSVPFTKDWVRVEEILFPKGTYLPFPENTSWDSLCRGFLYFWKTNLWNKWVLTWPKINWDPKKETVEIKSPFWELGVGWGIFSFSPVLLCCARNYWVLRAEQLKTRTGWEGRWECPEEVLNTCSRCWLHHMHELVKVEPYWRENYNYNWCCWV